MKKVSILILLIVLFNTSFAQFKNGGSVVNKGFTFPRVNTLEEISTPIDTGLIVVCRCDGMTHIFDGSSWHVVLDSNRIAQIGYLLSSTANTLYYNKTQSDARYEQPAQLATVATTGSYNDLLNKPTSSVPTAIALGARNFNQVYQLSSTRPSRITVSPQLSCNLSLTTGQSGQIILEISANGSTGWIFSGQISGSNTGTLTIGLATAQITGGQLIEDLPIGYYWRLRTNNITSTPTYTFNGGNEVIY